MYAPSASSASGRRTPSSRATPQRAAGARGALAAGRVRWDRLGRGVMLCVLTALVYLYISAGVHMLSTWRQSHHDNAVVSALAVEHTKLLRQREQLGKQSTLEAEARQLGMQKRGEQQYVVTGLPNN
jgi:hypothetical protein